MIDYIDFYSEANNLNRELVEKAIQNSQNMFGERGWNGGEFGKFTDMVVSAMQWKYLSNKKDSSFVSNDAIDYIKAYRYVQDVDLMRMLSYQIPSDEVVDIFVDNLQDKYENGSNNEIVIVDYGCGLAHWTIKISEILMKNGVPVKLILIDLDRISFREFLKYLCEKKQINYEFKVVTHSKLIPNIGSYDYCHIMAVLEHTSQPEKIIDTLVKNARDGAIVFGTFYDDPFEDFEHISADLSKARNILESSKKIDNLGSHWNPDTTVYQIWRE